MTRTPIPKPIPGMTLPKSQTVTGFTRGHTYEPFTKGDDKSNDMWSIGINVHYADHIHYNGIELYATSEQQAERTYNAVMVLIVGDVGVFNIT